VDALLLFWKEVGELHLQEEEEILFPGYLEAAPLSRREVDTLITDHTWLRDKLRELADLPRYENCSPLLISLAEYIVNHIRLEEHDVYDKIQGTLSEAQLESLSEASRLFRLEHRGEESLVGFSEDLEPLL
jgi:hemerythrin-like domain-containing protein